MVLAPQRWSGRYTLQFGAVLAMACAIAPSQPARAQAAPGNDELAAQATDPTASLMSFQLNDWYTANFHGLDDSLNQVVFRAAIPFALGDTRHIFRVTQPYVTSSPSGATGFADTTIFDLVVFNQPWGRWGVGISGTAADGPERIDHRPVDRGARAGFRQLVRQAIQLGPVRADVLLVRREGRRAGRRPRSTSSLSSVISSATGARCRSATARSSTTPRNRAGRRSISA